MAPYSGRDAQISINSAWGAGGEPATNGRGLDPRPSIPTPRAALLLHKPAQIHRARIAGIDIAGLVEGGGFQRAQILILWNIGRDLAVLGAADADALLEAGIQLLAGLRVGDIDHVVLVDGDAARTAELSPLGEEFPVLIQDFDAPIPPVPAPPPPP